MGLKDLVEEDEYDPLECPRCETEGEKTDHWYNRCTTDRAECEVLTWIPEPSLEV